MPEVSTAAGLVTAYFNLMGQGDARAAFELLADDAAYRVIGSTPISVEAHGRREIVDRVIRPFTSRLEGGGLELILDEVIDGGDEVAVALAHSRAVSSSGKPYQNEYAIVFRAAGGRITSITEFLDTALVETVVFDRRLVDEDIRD